MGILTQQLMSDLYNFEDLVAWDDKVRERYSLGYDKPNFLIQSSLELQDFCKSKLLCGKNQTCLNNYKVFPLQFNYMDDQVQYEKAQYSTYQYPLSVGWQNLTTSQKEYVIKMDLNRIFIQTLVINSSQEDLIVPNLIYSAKEQDGVYYQIFSMNFLVLFPQINNQNYGGPFKCDLVNGKYQQYKYTNVDQFSGFQYQDAYGKPCGNATNKCTNCSYYNQKRIFPVEWRCRTCSFGQPYMNVNPTTVGSTITFKVVLPNEKITSIQDEYSYQPDAVIATDIDLSRILDRYTQNQNINIEYSYLISTNPSSNSTQYSPLVIAHPLMNISSIQTVYDVEFSNSQNKEQEIYQFISQTSFLNDTFIIYKNCSNQMKLEYSQIRIITKNDTQYLTIFTPIFICFGTLYEQASNINSYYVKAVSLKKIDQDTYQVDQTAQIMFKSIFIIYSLLIMIILVLFYYLTKNFLFFNFEIPIKILTQFIQNADSESIFVFYQKINKKELKTSLELKNLIFAINNVVLNVQEKVKQKFQSQEQDSSYLDIQSTLVQQLTTFQAFSHLTGIGMCLNNMSIINMFQKNLKQGLLYMNLSNRMSTQMLQGEVQPLIQKYNISYYQAIQTLAKDKHQLNFLKICACRKYQLANLLYHYSKSIQKCNTNKNDCENLSLDNSLSQIFDKETILFNYTTYENQQIFYKESIYYSNKYQEKLNYIATQNNQTDEQITIQKEDPFSFNNIDHNFKIIYDPYLAFKSLKLLKKTINSANIQLNKMQFISIKDDVKKLNGYYNDRFSNELNFFEVFYEDQQQETELRKNSIFE
ncbi:hypothetical protein ABPG74_018345 [Tetrahymena malaccensis]